MGECVALPPMDMSVSLPDLASSDQPDAGTTSGRMPPADCSCRMGRASSGLNLLLLLLVALITRSAVRGRTGRRHRT
jgi:hypothetical protein